MVREKGLRSVNIKKINVKNNYRKIGKKKKKKNLKLGSHKTLKLN